MSGSPVDWGIARKVGGAVAGEAPEGASPPLLPGDLIGMCEDAERRVVAYTKLQPADELPPPESVGRGSWLDANLASMQALLGPATEKLGAGLGPLRPVMGGLVGAEVGGIVGYLSRRVLGQYDLWLLDADRPARLLFVAPNLLEAARQLEVDGQALVHWVAFHEVTHAVQFAGVPWLRPHLAGLLGELLSTLDVDVDLGSLLKLPSRDDLNGLVERIKDGGLVGLTMGQERQAVLDRVQATMAVVEGHAEHVMDVVGAEALDDLDGLRSALERRRGSRPPLAQLLERLLGMDLKMRQYRDGKAFCDAVAAEGGPDALHKVWASPEHLPTLDELADPSAWLRRVDAA